MSSSYFSADEVRAKAPLASYAPLAVVTAEPLPPLDDSGHVADLHKFALQLKLLMAADASIRTSGTVCRGQVEELVKDCDLALDARYPLASFTQTPSKQNVSIVTESIGSRGLEVIKALVKKAGELIQKLISWIVDNVKRLRARFNPVHQRVVYTGAIQAASEELKPVVDLTGASAEARQAFADAQERYRVACNNLALALLTESPLLSLLKSISLHMPRLATAVGDKVEYAEKSMAHSGDPVMVSQSLAMVAQGLPLGRLTEFATALPEVHSAQTLIDYFEQLKNVVTGLHSSLPSAPMDWVVAANAIINPHSGFDEPMIAVPDVIGKQFDQLKGRISLLAHPQIKENIDASLASAFDQAMLSLVGDVHALTFYVETVNLVLDDQAQIADALYRCAMAQFELYRSAAQNSGNNEWVEKVNAVQKKLRDSIVRRG